MGQTDVDWTGDDWEAHCLNLRCWPFIIIALVAVAVPPLLSAGWGIHGRWTPVSDSGVIGVNSADTLSLHPPLVGMPSTLSQYSNKAIHHPGPLLFWILSPFEHAWGPPGAGLLVGAAVVNVLAAVVMSVFVYRRTGMPGLLWTFILIGAFELALGGKVLRDPFNPSLAILPAAAFLILCWSIADGDIWALPWALGMGSFSTQAHVTFSPLFAAVLVVSIALLVARLRRIRLGEEPLQPRRRPTLAAVTAAVAVGVVCWLGPVIDQLNGSGNLLALVRNGGGVGAKQGFVYGLGRLSNALSFPPTWLRRADPIGPAPHPSPLDICVAAVVGLSLVALLVWSHHTNRRSLRALVVVAVVALAAGVATSAAVPASGFAPMSLSNRREWWPASFVAWLALTWGGSQFVRDVTANRRVPRTASRLIRQLSAITCLALATLLAAATCRNLSPRDDPGSALFGPTRTLAAAAAAEPRPPGGYLLRAGDVVSSSMLLPGILTDLTLRGLTVHVPDALANPFGTAHHRTGHEGATLLIRYGPDADESPHGYRLIALYDPANPPKPYHNYTTALLFAGRARAAIYYDATSH